MKTRRIIAVLGIVLIVGLFTFDTFSGPDLAAQTFYLRLLVVALCGWISYESYRFKKAIGSKRLSQIVYYVYFLFLVFTGLRMIATLVDTYIAFSIGWCSNMVNAGFYAFIALKIRQQRRVYARSPIQLDGRSRISVAVDNFFDEVESISDKAARLHQSDEPGRQ